MERNHCQATPPSSPSVPVMMDSCRRRLVRRSSRMTGITGDNSRGFLENEDMVSRGFQMAESMFREWTDEKHSLYLNSIEELFVKQLYNGKYHCTDLLGWQPKSEKLPKLNTSQQLNANTCSSTAEFKVLQDDCWQKKRAQPQLDIVGGCHVLLKNPWTQHFRSAGKRVVVSGDVISAQEKGLLCGQAFDVRGMKAAPCDVATSSKQLLTCQFHILNQASVGGMTEVSDQNFVDGDCEGEMLSNLCRAKKMKAVVADFSGKDQVVPFGNSPVIAKSHENNAFGKRKTCS